MTATVGVAVDESSIGEHPLDELCLGKFFTRLEHVINTVETILS